MIDNVNLVGEQRVQGGRYQDVGAAARRLIERSAVIRTIVKSPRAQHQIMTWRALRTLRGRTRFLAHQLFGRRVGRYELRRCGLTVHVRHRTGDVLILNKIFARAGAASCYEPPPEVAAVLATSKPLTILDVGANIGLFGLFALDRWPGARITAFEPDPDNLRVLRMTMAANDLGDRWTAVDQAASNRAGDLRFVPGLRAEAHIAGAHDDDAITVSGVDLFEYAAGAVDLVKMDIEGGEWAILADARLSTLKASVIRLEWHTMLCPASDAHGEAIRLLRAGGFTRILDADHEHERNGVLWAWRERS